VERRALSPRNTAGSPAAVAATAAATTCGRSLKGPPPEPVDDLLVVAVLTAVCSPEVERLAGWVLYALPDLGVGA
jgi:hypothetical protein